MCLRIALETAVWTRSELGMSISLCELSAVPEEDYQIGFYSNSTGWKGFWIGVRAQVAQDLCP